MCFPFSKNDCDCTSEQASRLACHKYKIVFVLGGSQVGVCVQFFLAQQLLPLAGFMNKTVFFNKAEDEDANLGERRLYNFSLKPTVRGGGYPLFFFRCHGESWGEGMLKKVLLP